MVVVFSLVDYMVKSRRDLKHDSISSQLESYSLVLAIVSISYDGDINTKTTSQFQATRAVRGSYKLETIQLFIPGINLVSPMLLLLIPMMDKPTKVESTL